MTIHPMNNYRKLFNGPGSMKAGNDPQPGGVYRKPLQTRRLPNELVSHLLGSF